MVLLPLCSGLRTLHVLLLVLVKVSVVVLQALPLVLLLLLLAVAGLARCYGVVKCSESAAASAALGPLSSSPPRRIGQLLLPGLQVVALLLVRIRMRSPHACCRVLQQQMRFHGGSDTAAELDGFEWRSSSVV